MPISTEIWVLIGPPCAGKSTYANKLARDKNYIRINRDDFRKMIKGSYDFKDQPVERIINRMTHEIINDAELNNRNVIIDATHCKWSYIRELFENHKENKNFVIVFFNIPLWKLKYRNIIRFFKKGIWIPIKVIDNMYVNYLNLKGDFAKYAKDHIHQIKKKITIE